MQAYTLDACRGLMQHYVDRGGEAITVREGILGLGTVVCYGPNLKAAVIQEHYQNPWSSYHTIQLYEKVPKKYESQL